MMKKLFSIILLLFSMATYSQTVEAEAQDTLSKEQKQIALLQELGKQMILSSDFEERRNANYAFIRQFTRLLKNENSYEFTLQELPFISVQYPDDNKFRIFTWQIETMPGLVRHYGAIQMNTKELKLIPLTDRSDDMEYPELEIGTSRNWYGAIYYKVQSVKKKNGTQYYLYGFDSHSPISNKKLVDVLQFTEDGDVLFGLTVFPDPSRPGLYANRFILEYREDAGVRLNYSPEEKKIIFDHLVPINEASEGIFADYVPDGSFDALVMKGGKFIVETNVVATREGLPTNNQERPTSDSIYDSKAKE